MQIKLWGVRGSLPSPISNTEYKSKIYKIIERTIKSGLTEISEIDEFFKGLPQELQFVYGGNTTCATVTSASGKLYIIDCGTGIRQLGEDLLKGPCGKGQGLLSFFITHNHWDHIQGLPFFKPLYIKGNELTFYTPFKNQDEMFIKQMSAPSFPASFEGTPSTKQYITLDTKSRTPVQLEDDLVVEFYPLKHPGGSFAYKFMQDGKIFIFATDAEFTGEILEKIEEKTDFFMGADLLVLDSQYTLDESFQKIDWGHTSYTMAVNCGIRWEVKNLVLTHHEPAYTDAKLYENYLIALEHRERGNNDKPNIYLAREGMTFKL